MSFIPKPYEIYKHFKGNLYQITAIAQHTETGEQLVVYQALYDDFRTYARPLAMFVERVDREKHPEAKQEFRFELQGPDAARQKDSEGEAQPYSPEKAQDTVKEETVRDAAEEEAVWDTAGEAGAEEPAKPVEPQERFCPGDPSGESEESQELSIDPLVLEFLDSDRYEQRLNILAGLHHRITDEMITTMAIACDIEVNEGDTEERYEALKACLLTLERYECNRLR